MPPLTPEQLIARQSFIGGSDAASICGVNKHRTAHEVYLEKIGQGKPVIETEAMRWGAIHEANIAEEYQRRTGRTQILVPESIVHPVQGFMGCHVDRKQRDQNTGREGIAEIKTTRRRLAKGECPESYQIQLYHNLICTQLTWGTVVILIQGSEMVWYDFLLTEQISRSIVTLESKFWAAVVAKDWSLFGVE